MIFAIALSIVGILGLIWCVLRLREHERDILLLDYYLELLNFRHVSNQLSGRQITPEQEFRMLKWEEALKSWASIIGAKFNQEHNFHQNHE